MTIAILIKVGEGLVMASDSAVTLSIKDGRIIDFHDESCKVFNLHNSIPMGIINWGEGDIDGREMSKMIEDFQRTFDVCNISNKDIYLNPDFFSVPLVADNLAKFFYSKLKKLDEEESKYFSHSFLVGGYSLKSEVPEIYLVEINPHVNPKVSEILISTYGQVAFGHSESITRLILGLAGHSPDLLKKVFKKNPQDLDAIIKEISSQIDFAPVSEKMSLEEAIALAEFLADLTVKFPKLNDTSSLGGGPIEIATITREHNFSWVDRTHM